MDTVLYYICLPLGWLMEFSWKLVSNYGGAIILFTLFTKIILMPISVWIHKNSINMVKIQPSVNFLKAEHYGDLDTFAEEQAKLFKKEKYHPLLTLVPLALQIFLLLGVVEIIYHPMEYLFSFNKETVEVLAHLINADVTSSSCQLQIIEAIKTGTITAEMITPEMVGSSHIIEMIPKLKSFDTSFLGFNMSVIPMDVWGLYILVPILAGFSSWILCLTQNLSNVIQHEQGKLSQYGLMIVSVGISLYLGIGVPSGIALYWIASNLFSVVQMYLLNWIINPKKYVDYAELEKSRKALADIEKLDADKKNDPNFKINKEREKKDYKKFFKIVNKHIVIYSEKSGFYKYYESLINELLRRSNVTIHYVTNDPNDIVFEINKTQPRLQPYYIGLKKLIPLMMKVESDIVIMTTPDLNKYYIKRSYMKKDIEYIFVPHDMYSVHMGFREGALDHFDTIFCTGEHVKNEVRATEKIYNLKEKKLVEFGYPFADKLIEAGIEERKTHKYTGKKQILIAPSWQEDNLLDSCIDTLIEKLYCDDYHIIVRPHPEYVKRYSTRMNNILERFKDKVGENLTFELDFSKNESLYTSDLLITDWSGIALEYCFATKRPALFINTELKCMNPNWKKIDCVPTEISLRDKIGISLDKENVANCHIVVEELFKKSEEYETIIENIMSNHLYNIGTAGKAGADYILKSLVDKKNKQNR